MDPLSIAAGVVGVVTPALHGLRLLAEDIGKIRDAPNVIRDLRQHVAYLDASLVSLQAVSEPQWESLGESVAAQAKAALKLCGESCDKFRASLTKWTRKSDEAGDGLSWRDRAVVGFFKQGQIKSMTAQLQSCNVALTSVVTMATLHNTLQQTTASANIAAATSTQEAEVKTALSAVEAQLAEIGGTLGGLVLAKSQNEEETDRTVAIGQAAVAQTALTGSQELLQQLLVYIRDVAVDAQNRHGGVQVRFGDNNQGSQIGASYSTVTNTFGNVK